MHAIRNPKKPATNQDCKILPYFRYWADLLALALSTDVGALLIVSSIVLFPVSQILSISLWFRFFYH